MHEVTTSQTALQLAPFPAENASLFTPEAEAFLVFLHRKFNAKRLELLQERVVRQQKIDSGEWPRFRPDTEEIRLGEWKAAPIPADLQLRRVEITGPVERRMVINALNSGANVFMADFEDANSPTWKNCLEGQINLQDAIRKTIHFTAENGKEYALKDKVAVLKVRPRGWHLEEKQARVDDEVMSGSLFDFGLYFFHNAHELIERGSGPYFYLPKLESHEEARLWNDVFVAAQEYMGIPQGTIKVTVLIETILAAFEMHEIIYELREHMAGLNAGRWDYIFSVIKKFKNFTDFILPDRAEVTMRVPFMRAYSKLLVQTCHQRGVHAIGGMAAFIPNRRDAKINQMAFDKVTADKELEASTGFDGTWVAHPDLVPVAKLPFDTIIGEMNHQKHVLLEDTVISATDLLDTRIDHATVTENGVRVNINVGILYIASWLRGVGAAAIHNLMEDAATAEISRAQVWQWLKHQVTMQDGQVVNEAYISQIFQEEVGKIQAQVGEDSFGEDKYAAAADLFRELIFQKEFDEFLTTRSYQSIY